MARQRASPHRWGLRAFTLIMIFSGPRGGRLSRQTTSPGPSEPYAVISASVLELERLEVMQISLGSTISWPRSRPAPQNWNDAGPPCSHRLHHLRSTRRNHRIYVACRSSCHRRPESGPRSVPLIMAIAVDHSGSVSAAPPGCRRASRRPASEGSVGDACVIEVADSPFR